QRFGGIADVPAHHHRNRDASLQLGEQMSRKRSGENNPPAAKRRQQQRRKENRVRRPEDRDRIGLEGERESDFRADVVAGEDKKRDTQYLSRRMRDAHSRS